MRRLRPKRIVVVGLVVIALSGVGFAVLEAMRPPNEEENAVLVRLAIDNMNGLISDQERARQVDALHIGIFGGWMVTPDAYTRDRLLLAGGALVGLMLVGVGMICRLRSRSVVTHPGS